MWAKLQGAYHWGSRKQLRDVELTFIGDELVIEVKKSRQEGNIYTEVRLELTASEVIKFLLSTERHVA